MPEGTSLGNKAARFAGFAFLNLIFSRVFALMISQSPLQAAQERNLADEAFVRRVKRMPDGPHARTLIHDFYYNRYVVHALPYEIEWITEDK